MGPRQLRCSTPDDSAGRSVLSAVSLHRGLSCQLFCAWPAELKHPPLQPLEVAALFALGRWSEEPEIRHLRAAL